uniref:Uncharacterized protein n=1 Tax=Cyprinus carpio carpio TaxID=630221 RepID=A0A9J8ADM9_CYPCA
MPWLVNGLVLACTVCLPPQVDLLPQVIRWVREVRCLVLLVAPLWRNQVTSLSQRVAEFEGLLERGERDRNSLNGQLEEAYKKLTAQETDSSKVYAELRFLLSQAQLKKEESDREMRDISFKLGHQLQ